MNFPNKRLTTALILLFLEIVLGFPSPNHNGVATAEPNTENDEKTKQDGQKENSLQKEKPPISMNIDKELNNSKGPPLNTAIDQDEKQVPESGPSKSEISAEDNNSSKEVSPSSKEKEGEDGDTDTKDLLILNFKGNDKGNGKTHGAGKSKYKTGEKLQKAIRQMAGGGARRPDNSGTRTWAPRNSGFITIPEPETALSGSRQFRPQQYQTVGPSKSKSPVFPMRRNPELGPALPVEMQPKFQAVHFAEQPEELVLLGKISKSQNELKQLLSQMAIRQGNMESILYEITRHFQAIQDY